MTNFTITDESQIDSLYSSPDMADPLYEQAIDTAVSQFYESQAQAVSEVVDNLAPEQQVNQYSHLAINGSDRDHYGVSVSDYKDMALEDFNGLSKSDINYYMSRYNEDSREGARIRAVAQRLTELQGSQNNDGWYSSGLQIED
ncbi:hypothetical protein [Vibrio breoganii]|uniref:hypothetical protein n=1 Tax=Vibrio breoganii TaxID=553239 RepID=UPI000C841F5B|nr:hypothetical protein [Vibrio breoganii]PMM26365.1 hypothetical protein BCT59_02670 [Vibrio breoganii]